MSSRFVFLSLSGVDFINLVANGEQWGKPSLRLHRPIEVNKAFVVQRDVIPVGPKILQFNTRLAVQRNSIKVDHLSFWNERPLPNELIRLRS